MGRRRMRDWRRSGGRNGFCAFIITEGLLSVFDLFRPYGPVLIGERSEVSVTVWA